MHNHYTSVEMSKLLKEQWYFIEFIHKTTLLQSRLILGNITTTQIRVLCEIALNIELGNIQPIKSLKIPKSFTDFMTKKSNSPSSKKRKILGNRKVVKRMIDIAYPSLHTVLH